MEDEDEIRKERDPSVWLALLWMDHECRDCDPVWHARNGNGDAGPGRAA